MITFPKPSRDSLNMYQKSYIDLAQGEDLIAMLQKNKEDVIKLLQNLSPEKFSYRYAPGKWNIPEILVHIMDAERIFNYRMLCMARGEKNSLPGFEENDYAAESGASERSVESILEEYNSVRAATISLLKSFTEKQFLRKGMANNNPTSVQIIAYMIPGHETHHLNVIKERYLNH